MSDGKGVLTVETKLPSWKIKWQISRNDLNNLELNKVIHSRPFSLSNSSWVISLNLCGNYINIDLSRECDNYEEILVVLSFGVESDNILDVYPSSDVEKFWRSDKSISAGKLRYDCLFPFSTTPSETIVCIITIVSASSSETTVPKKIDTVVPTLVQNLEHLFLSELQTDVIIKVKGNEFKSHRSILVARSTVFAAMFQQNMSERNSDVVEITDCEPDHFKAFLLYLYTEKADIVTADNAIVLHNIADKYAVNELKVVCVECVSLSLSIDSTCDALVLANMHYDAELLQRATEFFISNIKEIVQTEKWVNFSRAYSEIVTELFLKTSDYVKK